MSSGESDGLKIYDVTVVHSPTESETSLHGDWTANLSTTVTNGSSTHSTLDWNINTTPNYNYFSTTTYPYYWSYTKYMYQLRCPRCRKMNWAELDNVVPCKKCGAQLRAVSKKVDFDVAVDV